ncbi:DUF5681 domain-containing protein [Propionivibrio sp.]|uniref:DUF5681 domain-containing protein n=1 Tax=Propionivibrio sp. TaxID=2212460 RepID=UPI0039E3DDC2
MTTTEDPPWLSQHKASKPGWPPGQSGNPKGRPKGSRNRTSLISEEFEKEGSAVARVVIQAAKDGDIHAANIVLQRLAPPLKPRSEKVSFAIDATKPLTEQATQVLKAIADGEIDPDSGRALIDCICAFAGLREFDELTNRLDELEKTIGRR